MVALVKRTLVLGTLLVVAMAGQSPTSAAGVAAPASAAATTADGVGSEASWSALSQSSAASAERRTLVLVTTGKVNCILRDDDSETYTRCDARGGDFGAPRPDGCDRDWGSTLVLGEYGVARWGCVSDSLQNDNRLKPGKSVKVGPMRCQAVGKAVKCRSETTNYGFFLSTKRFDLLNRGGRRVLEPRGLDGLKPDMTVEEAVETDTLQSVETGCPDEPAYVLKDKYKGTYVVWRDEKVLSVNAWSNSIIRTTKGIGVGSTLRSVSKAYSRLGKLRKSGSPQAELYWVRTLSSGPYKLHFFFTQSLDRKPWAGDPVEMMIATRSWKPADGVSYHGCDTGSAS